ncbi:hypothetical protein Pan216_43650 [Planctomycetes bacterium Pan216]|uniref:HEAT repeat protein n=1 Tax=Kolteria novifilia TaxID=2527975 RepID=A0A518B944_9BACT|nr:hypothetical protein Pan216_43650 [Planctomycetes bacterium Pan216]
MIPPLQRWAWCLVPPSSGRSARGRRRQRDRYRRFTRALVNVCLGCVLVGCSSGQNRGIVTKIPSFSFSLPSFHEKKEPIEVLRDGDDPRERLEAIRDLAETKGMTPTQQELSMLLLIKVARTETAALARAEAVTSLGSYDHADARAAIMEAAYDVDAEVRRSACHALVKNHGTGTVDLLGRVAASDDNLDVRITATECLTEVEEPGTDRYLVECLRDRDITITKCAAEALTDRHSVDHGVDYAAWSEHLAGAPEAESTASATTQVAQKSRRIPFAARTKKSPAATSRQNVADASPGAPPPPAAFGGMPRSAQAVQPADGTAPASDASAVSSGEESTLRR